MAEAALWGQVKSLVDNAEARLDIASDSAYEMPLDSGVAKPRGFGKLSMPADKEPYMVWLIVVGSMVGLLLLSKAFKTAKA